MNSTIKKILLIDDEEAILFGFGQVLASPGVVVHAARTTQEAKALIRENSYDTAIVDMRLSDSTDMEGLDLITFIKSAMRSCRVIVLTAYGDDTVRLRALRSGADIFLEKPVDPMEIRNRLQAFGIYE